VVGDREGRDVSNVLNISGEDEVSSRPLKDQIHHLVIASSGRGGGGNE